jgi:hypothetical protein
VDLIEIARTAAPSARAALVHDVSQYLERLESEAIDYEVLQNGEESRLRRATAVAFKSLNAQAQQFRTKLRSARALNATHRTLTELATDRHLGAL